MARQYPPYLFAVSAIARSERDQYKPMICSSSMCALFSVKAFHPYRRENASIAPPLYNKLAAFKKIKARAPPGA